MYTLLFLGTSGKSNLLGMQLVALEKHQSGWLVPVRLAEGHPILGKGGAVMALAIMELKVMRMTIWRMNMMRKVMLILLVEVLT